MFTVFMECCYGVKERELDLILHSPGGSPQAAEQILEYLRTRFDYIRAIVPLQAKSAATMIALGCDEILVGAHSEIGSDRSADSWFRYPKAAALHPAHAILRDFERAKEQCKQEGASIAAWTPILRSYAGGLIEFCNQAIKLSMEVVAAWLNDTCCATRIWLFLKVSERQKPPESRNGSDQRIPTIGFARMPGPIRYPELQSIGLRVKRLEDDDALQDAVLSILHVNEITFNGPAAKIIENHDSRRMVVVEQNIAIQAQPPPQQPTNPPLTRQQRRALERQGRR